MERDEALRVLQALKQLDRKEQNSLLREVGGIVVEDRKVRALLAKLETAIEGIGFLGAVELLTKLYPFLPPDSRE